MKEKSKRKKWLLQIQSMNRLMMTRPKCLKQKDGTNKKPACPNLPVGQAGFLLVHSDFNKSPLTYFYGDCFGYFNIRVGNFNLRSMNRHRPFSHQASKIRFRFYQTSLKQNINQWSIFWHSNFFNIFWYSAFFKGVLK